MRPFRFSLLSFVGFLSLTYTFSFFAYSTVSTNENNPLDVITVTGSKLPSTSFAAHTVLTRATIDALNPSSTIQLLRSIPGLSISENSNGAGQSFIAIRGGESNFTLIMIDGVIVNDPTNSRGGGFDFNQLDPSVIERVEVYRGGISAVYGSDAISGVIHFFTQKDAKTAVQVSMGSNKQKNANLLTSHLFNEHLSGLLSASTTERFDSNEENYTNKQVLIKLDANYENFEYETFISYADRSTKSFAEDSGGILYANPYLAEHRDNTLSIVGIQGSYLPANLKYLEKVRGNISWHNQQETSNNPGIANGEFSGIPASNITSDYEKWASELNSYWLFSPQWQMLIGATAQKAIGENDGSLDFGFPLPVGFSLTREIYSAYGEINGNIDDLELNIGIRFENPTDFKSDTASRIGVSNKFNDTISVHGSFSQGYKLPSFFALAHPLIGNENLAPEESDNFELGMIVDVNTNTNIQVNYFYNKYTNLVDFDPELFTSVNRQSVTAEGLEWQVNSQITPWFYLQVHLTYLDTNIPTGNSGQVIQLRRRPKWQGGGFATLELSDFTTSLSLDSRSKFFDSAIPTGLDELGGFTQVNISTKWQYKPNLSFMVSIDNLFDKDYQESIGFTSTGIDYRIGVRYQFQ